MNSKLTLHIYFVVNIFLIVFLGSKSHTFYKEKESEYNLLLEETFKISIANEVFKRMDDNNLPYVRFEIPDSPKLNEVTIISETDTIITTKTDYYESLNKYQKAANNLQSILVWEGYYINMNAFQELWEEELNTQEIFYTKIGIKYKHKDFPNTLYSHCDTSFFEKSLKLNPVLTGLNQEIILQGYYNISIKCLLYYYQREWIVIMLIAFILFISLFITSFYIVRLTKLQIKELMPPPKKEEAEYIRIKKAKCYPLNEGVTFDVDRGMLITDDGREVILKPLMVSLFMEFVSSPYLYALSEDLWKKLWKRDGDPSNVLTQLISRTRETIELIEEVEIRNVPRNGYRLVVHSKGQPRDTAQEDDFEEFLLR